LDNSLKKISFSVDQIYTKETRDPNMPVRVLLVLGGYDILHNFQITKKGALDSQPQVIKFTICLPMVGGSLGVLPPLKLVAMV
jgi:hypothetical protein